MKNKSKSQRGFTIIELLIATTVFSTVLLIVTTGIIKIGQSYYKGLIQSRTQETTRNITEDISRAFQLASGGRLWGSGGTDGNQFCIGDTRFTYNLNQQVAAGGEALIAETLDPNDACNDPNVGYNRRELLASNMRLLKFDVDQADALGRTWRVNVKVAYGDNDLLTHYNDNGSPNGWSGDNNNSDVDSAVVRDATCRLGSQASSFCATAELDNLVKKRLN